MENLEGKVAFVTGGACGIGLSMAKAFLKAGMKVVIADIRQDRLAKAESILNHSEKVLAIELDVRDRTAIEQAANKTEAQMKRLKMIVETCGVKTQIGG